MNHKHISQFALQIANHSTNLTLMEQAMVKKLLKNKDVLRMIILRLHISQTF